MKNEQKAYDECDAGDVRCPSYLRDWRGKLKVWSAVGETAQLQQVNSWINHKIHFTEDSRVFGRKDFWASPAISLKGRGDCEDYAIAKYASLKALGFGEDRMRIVIVNDTRKKIGHAVLSVQTANGDYILDNQNAEPVLHDRISYYTPVYSINAKGRWINVATRRVTLHYATVYMEKSVKPAKMALARSLAPSTGAFETEAASGEDTR